MVIDKNSLQTNVRRQIEYYEKKCLNKDIQTQKILLIIGVIIGLYEYFDALSMFPWKPASTVSVITIIMIPSVISLIVTSVKKIYKTIKGGYSIVLGEVTDIQTTKHKNGDSKITYKYTIIVDHLRLDVNPKRFITRNFKHIYNNQILACNLRQIFPLHTMRLYFFDMETREVIFDLTDFIRL